jgi:inositol-phosphate phosphatase/L-galactose 1-phosphate phosphatase/histidinol-phosphatase
MSEETQDNLRAIRSTIFDGLHLAADISGKCFRKPISVDIKDDESPVTLADRETEAAIREIITTRFPEHGIYGEEQGMSHGKGGTWVIDPIDGTKSFLFGSPLFGNLLGYVEGDVVVAGGLGMPALKEIWYADRTGPTLLNDVACRVSQCTTLAMSNLVTSSPDFFTEDEYQKFEAVSQKARYRRFGGDCYNYAQLAGGWVDLVIESSLYPFDYLPLVPIVEQAGGVITDWQGNALNLDSGMQVIAAATVELHKSALEILNRN